MNEFNDLIYPDIETKNLEKSQKAPYSKFLPLILAIEFMGALFDTEEFNDDSQFDKRFTCGLKLLGSEKYKRVIQGEEQFHFRKQLRNYMVHQFRPNGSIGLMTRKDAREIGINHLDVTSYPTKKLLIILEEFYDDIKSAAENIIQLHDNDDKSLKKDLNNTHIKIHELKIQE